MAIRSRALLGTLLALALVVPGAIVGASVGAVFFVPAGSGLAGPAMALGYGLVGALLAVVAAVALARWLPLPILRGALVGSAVVAFLGLCLLVVRVHEVRQAAIRRRAAGPSVLARPYEVVVEVSAAGAAIGPPVRSLRLVQTADRQRVSWITRETEPQRCEDAMVGLEGADTAARLQAFASRVAAGVAGCEREPGADRVLYTVRWSAAEQLTAASEGALAMDARCLRALETARDLIDQVRAIHDRAGSTAVCAPVTGGLADR